MRQNRRHSTGLCPLQQDLLQCPVLRSLTCVKLSWLRVGFHYSGWGSSRNIPLQVLAQITILSKSVSAGSCQQKTKGSVRNTSHVQSELKQKHVLSVFRVFKRCFGTGRVFDLDTSVKRLARSCKKRTKTLCEPRADF